MKGTGNVHRWDSHVWWGQWSHWRLGWFCSPRHGQTGWPAVCLSGEVEGRVQLIKMWPQRSNLTHWELAAWGQISAMPLTSLGMKASLSESLLLHLQYANNNWAYLLRGILKIWRCHACQVLTISFSQSEFSKYYYWRRNGKTCCEPAQDGLLRPQSTDLTFWAIIFWPGTFVTLY